MLDSKVPELNQPSSLDWLVYMIECDDGSFYTGITNNLVRRLSAHASGRGAKYFLMRRFKRLVYQELGHSRSSASRREYAIKRLSRAAKLALIQSSAPIDPVPIGIKSV